MIFSRDTARTWWFRKAERNFKNAIRSVLRGDYGAEQHACCRVATSISSYGSSIFDMPVKYCRPCATAGTDVSELQFTSGDDSLLVLVDKFRRRTPHAMSLPPDRTSHCRGLHVEHDIARLLQALDRHALRVGWHKCCCNAAVDKSTPLLKSDTGMRVTTRGSARLRVWRQTGHRAKSPGRNKAEGNQIVFKCRTAA
jgi:hypothetical protein